MLGCDDGVSYVHRIAIGSSIDMVSVFSPIVDTHVHTHARRNTEWSLKHRRCCSFKVRQCL